MLSRLLSFVCLMGLGGPAAPLQSQEAPGSVLLRVAKSSDFGVIARVVKTDGIGRRLSDKELLELYKQGDLSKGLGGTLYTFEIEDVLTRGTDFTGAAGPQTPGRHVLIFKPRDGPYSPNEMFVQGERYLIFLTPIENQGRLPEEYKLEAGRVYYRAYEPMVGVVQLKPGDAPLLSRVRQLGSAVRPADPRQKLKRLKALTHSRDEKLRGAAAGAVALIQAGGRR
jgi:hypothetical protein